MSQLGTSHEPRQVAATRQEKEARLLHITDRNTHPTRLISRRSVMEKFDFPSVEAVRKFAKRRGIVHVMLGSRALYDPDDWDRALAPASSVSHGRSVAR